jgi:hypothetical protein
VRGRRDYHSGVCISTTKKIVDVYRRCCGGYKQEWWEVARGLRIEKNGNIICRADDG